MCVCVHAYGEREREREKQTETETDRDRQRETERQRQRETKEYGQNIITAGHLRSDPRESQSVDAEPLMLGAILLIAFLTAVRHGVAIYLKIQRLGSGNLPIYIRFLPILIQAKVNSIM